jgi:hypothetical protein
MYTKNCNHGRITRELHYLNIDMAIGKYQVQKVFICLLEVKKGAKVGNKREKWYSKTTRTRRNQEGHCVAGYDAIWPDSTRRHVVVSIHIIRHDTTLFYAFHMVEFTPVRHRQLTTKTVSLGSREENILPVC